MLALVERVKKVAEGAALMTETSVEVRIVSAVSNLLGNDPLERALHGVMEELGPPHFDAADRAFATEIRSTLSDGDIDAVFRAIGLPRTEAPLADFLVPLDAPRNPAVGSTDVGDVSWVVPTVQAHAPTVAVGTPFHTWQVVAQGAARPPTRRWSRSPRRWPPPAPWRSPIPPCARPPRPTSPAGSAPPATSRRSPRRWSRRCGCRWGEGLSPFP